LKPQNILVENLEDAKVKVCDFGISTITRHDDRSTSGSGNFGSPAYAAPEMPDNVTLKVDVFSFGVV
jgi:serine/threonine protein kinase